jgi:uncharacterized protein
VEPTAAPGTRLGSAPIDVAWTALQWDGFEHVIASHGPAGFRADSWMILADPSPARVSYQLTCDSQWQVTALAIRVTDAASDRTLTLSREPAGDWHAQGDRPLPDLRGCTDVDINRSPLTNTLPIRRLDFGAARDIDVVYVSVPELTVRRARQRYELLSAGRPVYRYESGSFRADLPVDDDGIVIDYPGLWRRVMPGHAGAGDAGAEDQEPSS